MFTLYNKQFYYFRFFTINKIIFILFLYSSTIRAQYLPYYLPLPSDDEKAQIQFAKKLKLHSQISIRSYHYKHNEGERDFYLDGLKDPDSSVYEITYGTKGEIISSFYQPDYSYEHDGSSSAGFFYQYDSLGRRIACYGIEFIKKFSFENGLRKTVDAVSYHKDSILIYEVKYNANNVGIAKWNNEIRDVWLRFSPLRKPFKNQLNLNWEIYFNENNQLTKIIRNDSSDLLNTLFKDSDIFIYSSSGLLQYSVTSNSDPYTAIIYRLKTKSLKNLRLQDSTTYIYSTSGLLQSSTLRRFGFKYITMDSAICTTDIDSITYIYNSTGFLIGKELSHNQEYVKYIDFTKNKTDYPFHSPKQCTNIYDNLGRLISSECYTGQDGGYASGIVSYISLFVKNKESREIIQIARVHNARQRPVISRTQRHKTRIRCSHP